MASTIRLLDVTIGDLLHLHLATTVTIPLLLLLAPAETWTTLGRGGLLRLAMSLALATIPNLTCHLLGTPLVMLHLHLATTTIGMTEERHLLATGIRHTPRHRHGQGRRHLRGRGMIMNDRRHGEAPLFLT